MSDQSQRPSSSRLVVGNIEIDGANIRIGGMDLTGGGSAGQAGPHAQPGMPGQQGYPPGSPQVQGYQGSTGQFPPQAQGFAPQAQGFAPQAQGFAPQGYPPPVGGPPPSGYAQPTSYPASAGHWQAPGSALGGFASAPAHSNVGSVATTSAGAPDAALASGAASAAGAASAPVRGGVVGSPSSAGASTRELTSLVPAPERALARSRASLPTRLLGQSASKGVELVVLGGLAVAILALSFQALQWGAPLALIVGGAMTAMASVLAFWRVQKRRAPVLISQDEQALERDLVFLADRLGGAVRVVDVVRDMGLSFEDAQALLNRLATRGHVSVEFDPVSQGPVYRIG